MLNIKNAEAHRLAQELAHLTGESLTGAVITSLRERLDRKRAENPQRATADELMEIGRRAAPHIRQGWKDGEDPSDFLYDERGLPK